MWISKVLYFFLIVIITFFVASFAVATKVTSFLSDHEEFLLDSNENLLSASIIAQNNDSTEALVSNPPLYFESFVSKSESGDVLYSLDLYIYKIISFKETIETQSLGFIIKNLVINNSQALLQNDTYHQLSLSLELVDDVIFNGVATTTLSGLFSVAFKNHTQIAIIDYEVFKFNQVFTDIKKIYISFTNINETETTLVALLNSNTQETENSDLFDSDYNRDIKNIDLNKPLDTLENIKNSRNYYYNNTLIKTFNGYNSYLYRYLIIEFFVLIPITYLLFFNKHVLKLIRQKKSNKEQLRLLKKQQIIEELNNNEKEL